MVWILTGIQQVKKLLVELKEQGRTILLVSHNYEDIEELCDVIYEMSMGKIQQKKYGKCTVKMI